MWVTLNEVPLAALGLLAAFLGGMCLLSYFRSVGYTPANLGELLGLYAQVGALLFAYYVAMAVLFFAPAAIHLVFDKYAVDAAGALHSMLAAIFGGMALSFALSAMRHGEGISLFTWASGTCAVLALSALLVGARKHVKKPQFAGDNRKLVLGMYFLCIGLLFFTSFYILVAVLHLLNDVAGDLKESGERTAWLDIAFVLAIQIFIVLNAILTFVRKAHRRLSVVVVLTVIVFLPVTLYAGDQSTIVRAIMTVAGIRHQQVVTLAVPKQTCRLVRSAVVFLNSSVSKDSAGDTCHDFNFMHVQGLVRSSTRWFIQPIDIEGDGNLHGVRLTIPDAGTEVVAGGKEAPSGSSGDVPHKHAQTASH